MPDTKIAVVEQGVYTPNQELVFWEPLAEQGLVAREQDVFEDYNAPIPQTTEDAVEDDSAHEFDDLTQVWSVTFVGRQLLWCLHPEAIVQERSPIQRALDRWRNMSEREHRALFEGTFSDIWSRKINWDYYDYADADWALPKSYPESPAYFREVQYTTRAQDQATISARPIPELAESARRVREALAISMMVPEFYLNPIQSNRAYHPYAYHPYICHPSRTRILENFYNQPNPEQCENLVVEL